MNACNKFLLTHSGQICLYLKPSSLLGCQKDHWGLTQQAAKTTTHLFAHSTLSLQWWWEMGKKKKEKNVGWDKDSLIVQKRKIIIIMIIIIVKEYRKKMMHSTITHQPLTCAQLVSELWHPPANSPQFKYWAWCHVVWNIPFASLRELS